MCKSIYPSVLFDFFLFIVYTSISIVSYVKILQACCVSFLLSCCLTSTEARWPIRDGDRVGRGRESERLDRGNRPKKTGETVDRRQNNGSVKAGVHCAIALSTAVLDRVTKTMSVAPLLMNNLDNSKQKTSSLLSPAPPPSSKISRSFDLGWNPELRK